MNYDILFFNIAVFVAAVFVLDYGADKFIDHTAIVANRLGVSQTLVAMLTAGAEWEELAVVIAAVAQNNSPLALGNVVGSVISNILAAFSLGLLFHDGSAEFDKSSKVYVTLLLVLTLPITILGYLGKRGFIFGSILIAIFGFYVVSVTIAIYRGVLSAPEPEDSSDGNSSCNSSASSTSIPETQRAEDPLILGFLALSLSGYILSHAATSIASELHISGTVYGITVLAFATTLPEKFIAIIGARKGHSGIVVANTAGSNIFLLTLCLGVVYLGENRSGRAITSFELAVALASVVAFAVIVYVGARRWMGAVLFLGYVAFFVLEYTVFRA